jgi:hypothetical protein
VPTLSTDALEGLSKKDAAWTASPPAEQLRRSLYMYLQRSLQPPMMTTFDQCDTTISCGRRDVSIVAPQALTLLNNQFMHQRAEALAATTAPVPGQAAQVRHIWQAILQRQPDEQELSDSLQHLATQKRLLAESLRTAAAGKQNSLPARVAPAVAAVCRQIAAPAEQVPLATEVRLLLDASTGIQLSPDGSVELWLSRDTAGRTATQPVPARRPTLSKLPGNNHAAVEFNGRDSFLQLGTGLLDQDEFTAFAVATDRAAAGHRELLSNWSGRDGNSTESLFVGLTGERAFRLSDALSGVGELQQGDQPFLLTAANGPNGAVLFQGLRQAAFQSARLPPRRLDTPWVIGQQGNIAGEYWHGHLSLLVVFERQLNPDERLAVQTAISSRFSMPLQAQPTAEPASPEQLALASLCLVLLNTNEFAFID